MKSESKKVNISTSAEKIFNYISNFNNFNILLPEQIENWRATETECFFRIKNMTDMGLIIKEKLPFSKVSIVNHPDVNLPFSFNLSLNIDSISENDVTVQAIMETDVNPMMGMMLKKPLDTFVNTLADKLKEKMESENSAI